MPISITTVGIVDAFVPELYTDLVEATGATLPVGWFIVSSPPWMSIDLTTGELTGSVPPPASSPDRGG